jgi:hypothetical protein
MQPRNTPAGIQRSFLSPTNADRTDLAPQIIVRVGDWGRITKGPQGFRFRRNNGTFVREGNIYSDGLAGEYGIPTPVEFGGGSEWITSQNAQRVDVSASADG